MAHQPAPAHVAAVRRFNRFHTRLVGALNEGLLASPLSLAQARVVYELAQADRLVAADLAARLRMDAGHLSRLVAGLEAKGLLTRTPMANDGRRLELRLTGAGRAAFAELDAASIAEVADLLAPLAADERRSLIRSMARIERLLGEPQPAPAFLLREPAPGDLGWIVHRHGVLYAQEYGWDRTFEALVARVVAEFAETHDPARERAWVVERDGEVVGSVFVVRGDEATAKLRLLYLEPTARGHGLGARLVDECLAFARTTGYRQMTLWTNSVLTAARRIYEQAGFRLVEAAPHRSFGHDLVGEVWTKEL